MKKIIVGTVLVVGLVSAGFASANWGNGGQHMGRGFGGCPMMDQATSDKMTAFKEDNKELLRSMVMKRAEQQALLRGATPDPVAASKIAGELFDIRTTLAAKGKTAGIPFGIGMMGGRGHGKGMGQRMGQGNMMNSN